MKKIIFIVLCPIAIVGAHYLFEYLSWHYIFGIFATDSILNKSFIIIDKDIQKYDSLKHRIVAFKFPMDTFYYKKDTPFAKIVVCDSGDTLNTKGREFYCNGVLLGKARIYDNKGNKVPQFQYNGVISQDSCFVMGDNPMSFDSRYWGLLKKDRIKGVSIWAF